MPYRTCLNLFFAFLTGGLSLGMLSPGEASEGLLPSEDAPVRFVSFRHDVNLREGFTAPAGTPAPSRSVKAPAVPRPQRRAVPASTPAAPTATPYPLVAGGAQLWLQPTSFTPYDRYMGTVRSVINHLAPHPATMPLVCQLMKEGRHFTYVMGDPYAANPPTVTAMEQAGDCKAKALWLYRGLGDTDALFVIGKTTRHSRTSHAWVYWRNENRWWILDCTNRSQPLAADSIPDDRYIPYYSYGRSGSYRHKATRLLINPISPNGGTPAVADHSAVQALK